MKVLFVHEEAVIPDFSILQKSASSGTAYAVSCISHALSKFIEVTVLHYNVIDDDDIKNNDVIVFITHAIRYIKDNYISKEKKIIFWNHNFVQKEIMRDDLITKIVCVSDYHKYWAQTAVLSSKVIRIYNPYVYEKVASCSSPIKKLDRLRLIFVGTLSKEKGFSSFLNILKDVSKHRNIDAVCCGGDKRDSLLLKQFDKTQNILYSTGSTLQYRGIVDRCELNELINDSHFLLYGLNTIGAAESFGYGFLDALNYNSIPLTLNRGGQVETIDEELRRYVMFSRCSQISKFLTEIDPDKYNTILNVSNSRKAIHLDSFEIDGLVQDWLNLIKNDLHQNLKMKEICKFISRKIVNEKMNHWLDSI